MPRAARFWTAWRGAMNARSIFFLISGGGSSLVEQPLDPAVTLEDFEQLHAALVTCGASIEEINTVRKHLSATKGGRLAAAAPRSMKLTLAISDVPPGAGVRDRFGADAAGPVDDSRCRAHRARIQAPRKISAQRFAPRFENARLPETPKDGRPRFRARPFRCCLLGAHELFHAAHHACEARRLRLPLRQFDRQLAGREGRGSSAGATAGAEESEIPAGPWPYCPTEK